MYIDSQKNRGEVDVSLEGASPVVQSLMEMQYTDFNAKKMNSMEEKDELPHLLKSIHRLDSINDHPFEWSEIRRQENCRHLSFAC